MVWLKDGGSPQDLDHDNYQCLEEAREQISETYISFNGGGSTENISVSLAAMAGMLKAATELCLTNSP